MIDRDVLVAAVIRRFVSAGGERTRHSRERWNVLLVVPLVEIGFAFGRDVHGVEQEAPRERSIGRRRIAGQRLGALEAQETLAFGGDTLRPGRQVLVGDRLLSRIIERGQGGEIFLSRGPGRGVERGIAAFIMTSAELGLSLKARSTSASLWAEPPDSPSFAASSTCASASSGSISIALRAYRSISASTAPKSFAPATLP